MKRPKKIPLKKIRLDGNTQPRVELDQELIREYADLYKEGVELPPLDVTFDGADYWLVDGFHRRWGGEKAELDALPCLVSDGTLEDARWASYAANRSHGLKRTNEDKKKAVMAALKHPSGAKLSDSQIAAHVGVNVATVGKYREKLESTFEIQKSDERIGRDGRTINTANIGKANGRPATVVESEPELSTYEPEEEEEQEELEPAPVSPSKPAAKEALSAYSNLVRKLAAVGLMEKHQDCLSKICRSVEALQ